MNQWQKVFTQLFIFLSSLAYLNDGFCTTTKEVFMKYPNSYFIETGSYQGDGIQNALNTGCFQYIHSIEISPFLYKNVSARFQDNPQVSVWLGDSSKLLFTLIAAINSPITFWLDGHCNYCHDLVPTDITVPILLELEAIKSHPIKTHTILIDDVRLFDTWWSNNITIDQVKQKILEINPNYQFTYEDGYVPNDVLVAYIE